MLQTLGDLHILLDGSFKFKEDELIPSLDGVVLLQQVGVYKVLNISATSLMISLYWTTSKFGVVYVVF